ncbi:MAG: heavy-metal-associated domain-containing protein [Jaaginema sp. PMC 1079.18]|nr:heavy-metal-associated domain-containing protein [Jaaginema sp. PMC 1080.18]MEC4851887.1 heavy-metal-associated domain-containing protein [Jaaginema sp. PMC 1079.18]MEC4866471.1 heavy-metal-associated domain-containing protein [Jaaginema sp. PMC 1078.18]
MTMQFKVPSIACEDCVNTIKEEILVHEPEAKVSGSVEEKTISVDTQASEESIKQMIVAVGHEVA